MRLDSKVTEIKGVGPELARQLSSAGITTISDLIDYLPRRYNDYSHIQTINSIKPGIVTVKAVIKQAKGRFVRRGMHITEAVASDDTGSVRLIWFNQPYRANSLNKNDEYFISGEFQLRRQHLSIMNPATELVSEFPVSTARIVPVYRETKDIKSVRLRKLVREVLPVIRSMPETLPLWLVRKQKLISYAEAYETMHFPKSNAGLEAARRRMGFEEVFQLILASLLNKHELLHEKAMAVPFNDGLARQFVANLPFKLTDDQRKSVWQIYLDMQKSKPMNRILEGDVGSGKTVVASMAALMVINAGFQVALMAPTDLLARQHADTIYQLLLPVGFSDQVSLLVGSLSQAQKKQVHKRIKQGDAGFIIGTHSLIQDKVDMHRLGLVIIDEQHRFGVSQRNALQSKAGHMPHVLSMTATPIPRSLALTLYGELDISALKTKPSERIPVKTEMCSPNSRRQLYKKIDAEIESGRQAFIVCPIIKESELLPSLSAEEVYKQLSKNEFKHRRLGLLHGKMKPEEKERTMQKFAKRELDILIATTVVEVGVNVPNASVMVIEGADRFGLAQIHQLRGRVGRSDKPGYCYLVTSDSSKPCQRLRALESSNDGFKLAELDLQIRGPGAIYGTFQHGALDLRIAQLSDTKLIVSARNAAQRLIDSGESLLKYKQLYSRVNKLRSVTSLD